MRAPPASPAQRPLRWLAALAAAAAGLAPWAAQAQIAVVVSASNPVTVSAEQVNNIFLRRAKTFPNGGSIQVVDQAESSAIRESFYMRIANKTPEQIRAMRSRQLFTGLGAPPRELRDSDAVKKFIEDNPSAIGYIEKSSADARVLVVLQLD